MLTESQLQHWLGRILQFGIMLAVSLVLVGGVGFLWTHGSEPLQGNIIFSTNFDIDVLKIWHQHLLASPIGWIELGLLTLVIAQILRVTVIAYYYVRIRDVWFSLFSFFILSIILYCLLWQ